MNGFLLSASGLLIVALLFVMPPLLRTRLSPRAVHRADELNLAVLRAQQGELDADMRSGALPPQAYEAAHDDLVRRVAEDVHEVPAGVPAYGAEPRQAWTAVIVALGVSAIAAGLYLVAGTPAALDALARSGAEQVVPSAAQTPVFAAGPDGEMSAEQIEGMVQRLAAKLAAQPDDAQGWRMLIRSYETLRRFDEAAAAYARLLKLVPETPELLADYAVVLGMTQGQTLAGEPEQLIQRALALDPDNLQALALAGSAAFERKDYGHAVKSWQRLLVRVPPDSGMARSIAASIDKARALQNGATAPEVSR